MVGAGAVIPFRANWTWLYGRPQGHQNAEMHKVPREVVKMNCTCGHNGTLFRPREPRHMIMPKPHERGYDALRDLSISPFRECATRLGYNPLYLPFRRYINTSKKSLDAFSQHNTTNLKDGNYGIRKAPTYDG